MSPLPAQQKFTLKYGNSLTITPTAGSAVGQDFYANGMTAVRSSTQPRGFDELVALYERYVVTRAQLRLTAATDSATNSACTVGIYVTNKASYSSTSLKDFIEGPLTRHVGVGANGTIVAECVNSVDIARFRGVVDILDNPELSGSSSSNPADLVKFVVFGSGIDQSETVSIHTTVEMVFEGYFIDPIQPAAS